MHRFAFPLCFLMLLLGAGLGPPSCWHDLPGYGFGLAAWVVAAEAKQPSPRPLSDGFESDGLAWFREGGDVEAVVRKHERTELTAHMGRRSEHICIVAGIGRHLYFAYRIGRAPVADDPQIALWLKADRPGIRLMARVVFPHERDPNSLQLLSELVSGDQYKTPGSWARLQIPDLQLATARQAQLLRAKLQREIDVREAYVDRVVLDLYAGPGQTSLYVDDLHVSLAFPLTEESGSVELSLLPDSSGKAVQIAQEQLLVAGRSRFVRLIRAPALTGNEIKEFGFHAALVDWPLDLERIEDLVTAGLWLHPVFPTEAGGQVGEPARLQRLAELFPLRESVLLWSLGMNIGPGQTNRLAAAADLVGRVSPRRPVGADLATEPRSASRRLSWISIHRSPIGSGLDLSCYRDWLAGMRYLALPGTFAMTWIDAGSRPVPALGGYYDAGPTPAQLRLMTYAALAAGMRAVGYWSDESLGRTQAGKERLLELGRLNLELELLGPYLSKCSWSEVVRTTPKVGGVPVPGGIRVVLLRCDRSLLVLPIWFGQQSQYVPGQLAGSNVEVVVPGVPETAQAWLVTPCQVRMLPRRRGAGGTKIGMPMLDMTAIIVLTADAHEVRRLQQAVARTRHWAALWSVELAELRLATLRQLTAALAAAGKAQPDEEALLRSAERYLEAAREALEQGQCAGAYLAAGQSLQAIRILERAHWQQAANELCCPEATPHATSLAGLPEHWRLIRLLEAAPASENLLGGGDFDSTSSDALASAGWRLVPDPTGLLALEVATSASSAHGSGRSLHLAARMAEQRSEPALLATACVQLISPPVPLHAGDLIQIDFWLRVPNRLTATFDGVLVYDSLYGRPLAVSQLGPTEWKRYTLYRPIDQDALLRIVIAMTGLGEVFLDDLTVRRILPQTAMSGTGDRLSSATK